MLKKNYSKTGTSCRVTFKVPAELGAETAAVLGEFNGWDASSHPMKKRKDGSLSATISIKPDAEYRFRYLLDGTRWENDVECDDVAPNRFGSSDGILAL